MTAFVVFASPPEKYKFKVMIKNTHVLKNVLSNDCTDLLHVFETYNETRSQSEFNCSKLTIEKLEQSVKYTPLASLWHRFGAFTVNFKHISHLVLVFLLNFEQVIPGLDIKMTSFDILVGKFQIMNK